MENADITRVIIIKCSPLFKEYIAMTSDLQAKSMHTFKKMDITR